MTRDDVQKMAEACDLGRTVGPLGTLLDHEWEDLHRFALMAAQSSEAEVARLEAVAQRETRSAAMLRGDVAREWRRAENMRERAERAEAERDALRADAERMDSGVIALETWSAFEGERVTCVHSGIDLRAAIDAAKTPEADR